MIKKLNAVLLVLVLGMLAAKFALDFAEERDRAAPAAAAPKAVRNAGLAPRVIYDAWLPYALVNPMTGRNGYILDVMRAVFPEAVFDERELTPDATRALLAADSNAVCVVYGDHPRLRDLVRAPTPLAKVELALYYRRGLDWKYTDAASLGNIRIGVTEGYLDCPVFRRLAEEAKGASRPFVVFGPSSPYYLHPLRAVLDGKIDAVGYTRVSFDAATLGVTAETLMRFAVSPTIESAPIFLTVAGGDPAHAKRLVEAYERGYREIAASGELRRIGAYYGIAAPGVPGR